LVCPGVEEEETIFFPKTEFMSDDLPMFGSPTRHTVMYGFSCSPYTHTHTHTQTHTYYSYKQVAREKK
jgi:hypothetical protein